jgi:hypothetical protein
MLRLLHVMSGRYRLQYGRLDDFGEVIQWLDYPPANGRYITRRVPLRPAPTIESHGLARW